VAIAEVGAGSQRAVKTVGGADLTTLAFPANVVSGNLLVVLGSCFDATGEPASIGVSDSRSTIYSVFAFPETSVGADYTVFIAYGIALSSGACTVTVNPAGSASDMGFAIDEFSGVNSTPLDVDGGVTTQGSATPEDTILTVTANDLVVGILSYASSSTSITKGASYTEIGQNTSTTNAQPFGAEFAIVTTATTYTVDWTLGASRTATVYTAAFKPATGAAISGYSSTAQQAALVSFGD
jgi:hypothetical protein